MKRMKLLSLFLALVLLFTCLPVTVLAAGEAPIVILYENDAHCAVEGYAKLAAMKAELAAAGAHVGVVSAGDFIQGDSLGAASKGADMIALMNLVGYDAITLGNHEFDYRLENLFSLSKQLNTKPICSNFISLAAGEPVFAPYTMVSYGGVDIAYIGVTTPLTLTSSLPAQFYNAAGEALYSFCGDTLYSTVQTYIDKARAAGAEYVIALSHLGTTPDMTWSAQSLVKNTTGLDVVLDGHTHNVLERLNVKDASGRKVLISTTGNKFENIGKLTIQNGSIEAELVPLAGYEKTDASVTALIEKLQAAYEKKGARVIGSSQVTLEMEDEQGNWLVRFMQTNLGDFCADAFRITTGADIGLINGGGIRAGLNKGKVTFNDLINVFPFNNTVCVAEVTGRQLVDLLEFVTMKLPAGNGSFQHVSGLTFHVNDSIPSSVVMDGDEIFVKVAGTRRVSNVQVLDKASGKYLPIDLDKTYTVASHNYLLKDGGSGAAMLNGIPLLEDSGLLDVEMLETYITQYLGGTIGKEYETEQGRITVSANVPTADVPEATAPEAAGDTYTVQKGDTLWQICRKSGLTIRELKLLNPGRIRDARVIQPGWELKVA